MSNNVAVPLCAVEVYPFEGGAYQILGGQILSLTTEKNIRRMSGTFQIVLAPGGPYGANVRPSWTEIITPMSFCLIGLRRWQYSNIVMMGVVQTVEESQQWTEGGVVRTIVVTGRDFGCFFEMFNFVALTFLGGLVAANAVGTGTTGNAAGGLAMILGKNYSSGSPDQIAQNWYQGVMVGPNGVLANTSVNWGGRDVTVGEAMAALFEKLPVEVPFAASFISQEGTWEAKFRAMLDWPIYEFFVNTAPVNAYAGAGGTPFTMQALGPDVVATPFVVGRINPIPRLTVSAGNGSASITGVDTSLWSRLPHYKPDSSFLSSMVSFDASEARNFYLLNPVWLATAYGATNAAQMSWVAIYGGFYDPASIHRYGFRPEYHATQWFSDYTGAAAQNKTGSIAQFGADITARIASWYHPLPLMATAAVSYPLRPDILVGTRFSYQPFKAPFIGASDPSFWDFYVETVSHSYRFGSTSTTTLGLCRGLPKAVYDDQSGGGLLAAIMQGRAERVDGSYSPSLPGSTVGGALQSWNLENAQNVAGQILPYYNTPQKTAASGASGT